MAWRNAWLGTSLVQDVHAVPRPRSVSISRSMMAVNPVLADIEGFNVGFLKRVDTQVTTPQGKKLIERRDESGSMTVEQQASEGIGFCPDYTPDKTVGVATTGLLVSSQDVAQDSPRLRELGITHILNVGYGIPNAFPEDFTYQTVEMFDDHSETLLTHYPECEAFIDQGRENGAVLIHCNAGRSRSASIALAYVMHRERLPLSKALERLRQTRPVVEPNEEFMRQLERLQNSLGIDLS